jgi:tetratricopeptide (TPR) repeat protein
LVSFAQIVVVVLLGQVAGEPATTDPARSAEQLFVEGRAHYQRGDYPQAIDSFSRAYALFPAPLLLFNLAQAQRLTGDCPAALRHYRRFVELTPAATEGPTAQHHIRTLEATCGPTVPLPAAPLGAAANPSPDKSSRPALDIARPAPAETRSAAAGVAEPSSTRVKWARFAALTVGLAAGASALAFSHLGSNRFAEWKAEDRLLSQGVTGQQPFAREDWAERQASNDRLAGSVQRFQNTARVMALVSAVTLMAGTVLSWPAVFKF